MQPSATSTERILYAAWDVMAQPSDASTERILYATWDVTAQPPAASTERILYVTWDVNQLRLLSTSRLRCWHGRTCC